MKRSGRYAAQAPHSTLLYGRWLYRHVGPGRDDFERVDNSGEIARYSVGEVTVVFAGAPGTGRWTYRVLAVNAMGVWAAEISNDVRELDPSEIA